MLIRTEIRIDERELDRSRFTIPINIILRSKFITDILCTLWAEEINASILENDTIALSINDIKKLLLSKTMEDHIGDETLLRFSQICDKYFTTVATINGNVIRASISERSSDYASLTVMVLDKRGSDYKLDMGINADLRDQYQMLDINLQLMPNERCTFSVEE